MAILSAAIKGKMGNTEYFISTMPVRELVNGVRPASELDDWATMSVDEKIQRDLNMERVMNEIAPYLAENKDRFFSSLLVLVYQGEILFEPISSLGKTLPMAYKNVSETIGFLTIEGGSLVVLDGQHRHAALEYVLKHKLSGPEVQDIVNDQISVIFITHESDIKTRRIFNRINRYAKQTSKGDNIITSEDDLAAIIARRLLDSNAPFGIKTPEGEDFVNWKNNTISARSKKFTTIATLHECIVNFLSSKQVYYDPNKRPIDTEIQELEDDVIAHWDKIISKITAYKEAFLDTNKVISFRDPNNKSSLIFKPAGQQALYKAILSAEKQMPLDDVLEKINDIDFSLTNDIWRDIIIRANGTIDAKKASIDNAALLIDYLIRHSKMKPSEISAVKKMYNEARSTEEDLPTGV